MDYVVNYWQEITSIIIVIVTVILFLKRSIEIHTQRKRGICSQDEHCAIAKIRAVGER